MATYVRELITRSTDRNATCIRALDSSISNVSYSPLGVLPILPSFNNPFRMSSRRGVNDTGVHAITS